MIQIYKPTKNVTGAAISLQAGLKDKHLYLNFIKQASWNDQTKKGSFIENRNKPGFSTVVKFNQVEVGAMLDALEKFYAFSAFHSSDKSKTQITFGPADGEQKDKLYVLKIHQTNAQDTTQKTSFFIPITFGEARLIQEYLRYYLHTSFRFDAKAAANKPQPQKEQTRSVPNQQTSEPNLSDFESSSQQTAEEAPSQTDDPTAW